MSAHFRDWLFWLFAVGTLCAIVVVAVQIAGTPDARYPVTSAVLAAVLLLGLLYLALRDHFDEPDARYERQIMRDMAKNMDDTRVER